MAKNMKEIIQNDADLLQLLRITDNHSQVENGLFRIEDINGVCAQITTIEVVNPKTHTRRIAWTLVGRLLLGLTKCYSFEINLCFESSYSLIDVIIRNFALLNQINGRKAKETKGRKRKRTTNVSENKTDEKKQRFWEHPLELDENVNKTVDTCLVPFEQITLREHQIFTDIDMEEQDIGLGFGDDKRGFQFDEDDSFESVGGYALDDGALAGGELAGDVSVGGVEADFQVEDVSLQPLELDENMNDIVASSGTKTPAELEAEQIISIAPQPVENAMRTLSEAPLLSPPAVPSKRSKRKRPHPIHVPAKSINYETMQKRIANVNVDCKRRRFDIISGDRMKFKQNEVFAAPVMFGSINRTLFGRKVQSCQTETNWNILEDVFGQCNDADQNGGSSEEINILRGENTRPIRRSTRMICSFNEIGMPLVSSTPVASPRNSFHADFNAPRSQSQRTNINMELPAHLEISEIDVFTPPEIFQNSAIAPPRGFGFTADSMELDPPDPPVLLPDSTVEDNVIQSNEPADLATLFSEKTVEYETLSKLIKLWRQNVEPINVDSLLDSHCNRLMAARTFSSLLTLKKRNLIELANSSDGKITHISHGDFWMHRLQPNHTLINKYSAPSSGQLQLYINL